MVLSAFRGNPPGRGGHNLSELQSEAGLGHSPGTGVGARCRHCEGVADTGVGCRHCEEVADTDARCRHCEGVVDIVRGSSTPRGGYNARWCQYRASVPITNVRAGGPRRRQVRRSRRPTGTATCLPQWVFSRSDAVGLTQEATAGRAMSTSMVALNGRPGAPGRLLTHGPRRARAQSHRGRQQCIGVDNLPTPIGGSLPQCGSRARRESGGLIRARSHSDSTWTASGWGPVVRLTGTTSL